MSPSQIWASQVALVGKNPSANAGDLGDMDLIPGWGRSPGLGRFPREGHGNPLQYACLENPMDRGAWWATVSWGRKESYTTEQLSIHPIWVYYYMVICLLWFSPNSLWPSKSAGIMALGESPSAGWALWLTPQADEAQPSCAFHVCPWMVPQSTLESLQIQSNRNWKLTSYNQNGNLSAGFPLFLKRIFEFLQNRTVWLCIIYKV